MDRESRRIAELLAKLSEAERLIYRNLLISGAHLPRRDETQTKRRAAVRALVISATYHTPEKISVEIVSPDALFGL